MNEIFKYFFALFIFSQTSFAQKYDSKLVSKTSELNFSESKMRGFESNGIIYYVQNDLQTLTAYKKGKLKWQTNIISICGKPSVGKSEIRYVKLKTNKILIVYGKHSFAEVLIDNGNTKFIGSD